AGGGGISSANLGVTRDPARRSRYGGAPDASPVGEPAGIGLPCGAGRGMGTVAGAAQAGRAAPSCFPFTFRARAAPEAPVRGGTVSSAGGWRSILLPSSVGFRAFFAFSPHFRDSPCRIP